MKGKIGLVVGIGVGYVLGTRAGRERYEQIKTQWLKVWNLDPVQDQVDKVKGYVGDKAAAVPGAIWTGVQKVVKSASGGDKTAGQRLDSAVAAGRKAADDIVDATEDAVEEVKDAAKKDDAKKPAAKKPASSRSTAAKSGS
ncbi:hypothetical protein QE375_002626 [Microbacterium foliorum]|jgi:hypothetical protein|uniref:YtxH domain-containing protein n=1 Tax=Microbacterium foliorum TaxID=104336 RepID=A0ABU1HSP9_9MICO|nr:MULTISPECIES: hypothetical protein [Microbacterium]AQY02899.1 hypothetical protein B2G67_16615 [Microbacterium foliorum]KIP89161.1 hypothetical protein RU09_13275 [Microbacterium sp. MEJ108Y]KQR48207.1 hypothetical protein ASF87_04595 [Microbacterium sp. Leaf161]MDR6143072.1 hypothetical protein [Microbacterium foliorum]